MTNALTLNSTVYDDDALRAVSADRDVSLDGRSLDVDTMEATIEGAAALTEIDRAEPATFSRGGNARGVWYVSGVVQTAPSLYRLEMTSALGLLAQREHRGGMYTGQSAAAVIAEICGTLPHTVSSAYAARPVYGWLPYRSPSGVQGAQAGSAKDNLLQVLFALGAFLRADTDGTLLIGELPAGSQSVIEPDRIYVNGAYVEHEEPVTEVTVLEHQYVPGTDAEPIFSGTATAGQVIVFDEPMSSLSATGFTITASGANYAVLAAGTGTLTGVPYVHTAREKTQILNAVAAVPNRVRVEDATLINATNSADAADRLAAWAACRTHICVDAQVETEQPGDVVSIWDPFAQMQRNACIEEIFNIIPSNVMRGSVRALVGFTPPDPGDSEQVFELLTGSGTWTPPAGVTEVSAVLISGGQGGSPGADGGDRSVPTLGVGGGRVYVPFAGRIPGVGGDAGSPGEGGKILQITQSVTPGVGIAYACGAGGAKTSSFGGSGSLGTDTVFGSYSSANGDVRPGGVLEPSTQKIYGSTGRAGVRGNDGTGYPSDGIGSWSSQYVEPDPIVVDGVSYANGSRSDAVVSAEEHGVSARIEAGYGGGAAYKAAGGYADNEGTISIGYNPFAQAYIYVIRGVTAGAGADAAAPEHPLYGQGGSAGHGGGGAGGYSGGGYYPSYVLDTPTYGSAPGDHGYSGFNISPASGGHGSAGTDGGAGCILLYYRIPASTRTLVSIAITTPPTKTAYTAGESFDPTGMVVTATYDDSTTAPVTGYTVSPSGSLATTDTQVTISYTAGSVTKTATQAITVTAAPVTLTGISITTPPTKVAYYAGESFETTGMVVTATYSNGTSAAVTGYTVSPSGALSAGTTSVTVSYAEGGVNKTDTQAITVLALALTGISITTPPTKTAYTAGEVFDPTGMVVTASYNSGATAPVSGYTWTPSGSLATTDTTITVSYTEGGVTRTATQAITVAEAPSVYAAYTSPQSGVTYTDGISGLTESELTQAARAISDNAGITNATTEVWISVINRHIAVGDTISVTMDGNAYAFRVVGFNHYALTSATAYGAATATGKAGIALEMVGLLPSSYTISASSATAASWDGSDLCAALNGTIYNLLPSALQGIAKQFDALYGNGSTVASRMTLASEYELTGASSYASGSNEGAQLAYWNGKTQADLIRYDAGGTASGYWTRSRATGPGTRYAYISATGAPGSTTYSTGRRISPIFCI